MNLNPNGESSVSAALEGPDRPVGLVARVFRAFPAAEQV